MKCNVARDLFPLYFDGLCSDETRKQLEEHMKQCEKCRQLKQNIESEQEWSGENKEWNQAIAPLKKVKKKIRRKNILIACCIFFILLLTGTVSLLAYGQITKKGVSFELLYDAVRFQQIGKQFASGNIEPLYETFANGYMLQDEESGVLRLVYGDKETYDEEMKEAILEKYHQYFDGKDLTYKGIEEIGYLKSAQMGWDRTLYLFLKFEGSDGLEYYLTLYKNLNGQYLVDDYFGHPYLFLTSEEAKEEAETPSTESYHTNDTLFSCLPNTLSDFDLCFARQVVLMSGQRALQGDKTLAENGQMRFCIVSEQDLAEGTDSLRQEINDRLDCLAEKGYYLTDVTWNVKEYDKNRHLYRYQITMELTNEESLEEMVATLDCYRVSEQLVYIPETSQIYGEND